MMFVCKECGTAIESVSYIDGKMVLACKKCGHFIECPVDVADKKILNRATRDHVVCLGE